MSVTTGVDDAGSSEEMSPSEVWSDFVPELRLSELPDEVKTAGLRAIAGVIDSARRGAGAPLVRELSSILVALGSAPQSTAAQHRTRIGATYAAMINGTAATLGAERETLRETSAVLSCSVVPAAIAAAELHDASLANVLVGVAAGLECALRLARALGAEHISRGWELGGSAGCVGAALAAARVLGIRDDHVHASLGFAATQAAGVQAGGPDLAALVSGKAAADGLESALLGQCELTGPPLPLEGRRGLLALVTRSADLQYLVDGLTQSWLITASVPFAPARPSDTFEALSRKLSYGAPINELAEMLNGPSR